MKKETNFYGFSHTFSLILICWGMKANSHFRAYCTGQMLTGCFLQIHLHQRNIVDSITFYSNGGISSKFHSTYASY